MVVAQSQIWHQASHQALMDAIAQIRALLEYHGQLKTTSTATDNITLDECPPQPSYLENLDSGDSELSTVQKLRQAFQLSTFECNILMLCAGMELSSNWGKLCANAQDNSTSVYPTFGLAYILFAQGDWYALTPMAPLRRYRLIEVLGGAALMTSQLRLDERILHYLTGISQVDERLQNLVEPVPGVALETLVPSHQTSAWQVIQAWVQASRQSVQLRRLPLAQLGGRDRQSHQHIAAAICNHLGLNLYTLSAQSLPIDLNDVTLFRTLCEREYLLDDAVYLMDLTSYGDFPAAQKTAIAHLIETLEAPVLISSSDRYPQQKRPQIYLEIQPPTKLEQQHLWQRSLANLNVELNGHVAALTSHFNLNSSTIEAACFHVQVQQELSDSKFHQSENNNGFRADDSELELEPNSSEGEFSYAKTLWSYCRSQARPRLDELAQRIEARSSWDNLVLPEKERMILGEIAAHVRQRSQVYDIWGFGKQGARGLGISALFAGASGTGKTLSAEVLANDLHLDLYRIDLSSIVSKYIGETEKNLRRVFDAAEGGGVILLFDEADALFGKRSEVKDSHDRYANMEVSYLLQRMESYQGLAILTTNLKGSIDQAFLRRIRFVVQFPFPDASQRAEIWRRIFPDQMPREDLKYDKLAKLSVAGGNIRNIALNAAFLAADANESVGMKHLLQSAQAEYLKLERPLTDSEVKGWL
jgi:hypothetical protein